MNITFNKSASDFILDTFNLKFNEEGFIVDKNNELVESNLGEFVHRDDFSGIKKHKSNQYIIYTKSIVSLMKEDSIWQFYFSLF